ncbi:hypothetical protein YC2023_038380 [Brassica napus]
MMYQIIYIMRSFMCVCLHDLDFVVVADWEALEGREPSQLLSVEDYWTKQRNESGPKKLFLNSKQRKESPRSRCILDNIQGMICDVVFTSKLTDEEAKWIMETAQSFYLNDTRYKLLER